MSLRHLIRLALANAIREIRPSLRPIYEAELYTSNTAEGLARALFMVAREIAKEERHELAAAHAGMQAHFKEHGLYAGLSEEEILAIEAEKADYAAERARNKLKRDSELKQEDGTPTADDLRAQLGGDA